MKITKPIIIAIAIAASAIVGVVPAQTATALTTTADGQEIHCTAEVTATLDQNATPAPPICFATQDEVSVFLESIGVSQNSAANRGLMANTVVGTVYQDANRGGGSLTFWGSSGCAGVTFGFPALASGWDNNISSAEGSNGCWLTLYTAISYGGSRLNCTPYCASVGTWNDNVKALVFRPVGTFG